MPVWSLTVALRRFSPRGQVFDLEALERAQDGAFGLEEQIGDRRRRREGLVAQREVEQQILTVWMPSRVYSRARTGPMPFSAWIGVASVTPDRRRGGFATVAVARLRSRASTRARRGGRRGVRSDGEPLVRAVHAGGDARAVRLVEARLALRGPSEA